MKLILSNLNMLKLMYVSIMEIETYAFCGGGG